jgi:hypothetical protein
MLNRSSTVLGKREHSEVFFFSDSAAIQKELKLLPKASLKSDHNCHLSLSEFAIVNTISIYVALHSNSSLCVKI